MFTSHPPKGPYSLLPYTFHFHVLQRVLYIPLLAPIGFLISLSFCYSCFLVLGWFFSMPVCVVSPTCCSIVWLSIAAMPAPAPYKKISRHLTKKARTKANKVAKKCKDYTIRTHSSFTRKSCNVLLFQRHLQKASEAALCTQRRKTVQPKVKASHVQVAAIEQGRVFFQHIEILIVLWQHVLHWHLAPCRSAC